MLCIYTIIMIQSDVIIVIVKPLNKYMYYGMINNRYKHKLDFL